MTENWLWERHAKAEQCILSHLQKFVESDGFLQHVQAEMLKRASVHLYNCLDYICVPLSEKKVFEEVGYTLDHTSDTKAVYVHPGAQLARVVFSDESHNHGVALSVEDIEQFLMVFHLRSSIMGSLSSPYRKAQASKHLWVVQKLSSEGIAPEDLNLKEESHLRSWEKYWKVRPRLTSLDKEDSLLEKLTEKANQCRKELGGAVAASLFLRGEREYWQARNVAAQIQKGRQDRVGIGWANHDHHTFRSSRQHFQALVNFMKALGFFCRERFYAGEEAGWGAQVMEHKGCHAVLFLDVDLTPEETAIDFSSEPLKPLDKLGTVGLWCALHGDSILQAGMHHLEAQFDFAKLRDDLAALGVDSMNPFSDFPYLKQAFTKGEVWEVAEDRLEYVYNKRLITKEQRDRFSNDGAIGSHLENLERKDGYKGFNQKNVSCIIERLDLRKKELL